MAKTAGDLIGNKIANRTTKVLRISPQNNSEGIANENDKEILQERFIYPDESQKIINDLRLI